MAHTKKKPAKKAPKKRRKHVPVKKGQEVAIVKEEQSAVQVLSLTNMVEIMEFGKVLNKYIKANKLSVVIEGKDYPLCGAWKYAGVNFGLTAVPVELIPQHKEGQYVTLLWKKQLYEGKKKDGSTYKYEKDVVFFSGWAHHTELIDRMKVQNRVTREKTMPYYSYKCVVEVQRNSDGKVMTKGTSVCTNMEDMKAGFQEYAIMGQAQTRTISRALRNLLDFVLQAAGMEPTPGEEMPHEPEDRHSDGQTPRTNNVTKPPASDYVFKQWVERAKKGEKVLDKALENLSLTDEQIEVLEAIEKKPQ